MAFIMRRQWVVLYRKGADMVTRIGFSFIPLVPASCLAMPAASAQASTQPDADAEDASSNDIIVAAQHIAQRARDVPITLSVKFLRNAFDRDDLLSAGNSGGGFGIPAFLPSEPRFYGARLSPRF